MRPRCRRRRGNKVAPTCRSPSGAAAAAGSSYAGIGGKKQSVSALPRLPAISWLEARDVSHRGRLRLWDR